MVADEQLRSALQFVVDTAAGDARRVPPVPSPAALRPYLRSRRLPVKALGALRAALDADEALRQQFAARVTDVVDELGRLWLQRPDGWQARLEALAAASGSVPASADRRREAAERALTKERAEHAATRDLLAVERRQREEAVARVAQLDAGAAALRRRVGELEASLAKAERRARRAQERAEASEARARAAETAAAAAVGAVAPATPSPDLSGVRDLLRRALAEVEALAEPARGPDIRAQRARPPQRVPVKIPAGRLAREPAAVEHLLRTQGAQVLVDGYNVAKLGWPHLDLHAQRAACLDAVEAVAARFGLRLTVVFDGAEVVGAAAPRRRHVRVAYSCPPESADDLLRAMVAGFETDVPVVVVTSDREIVRDVTRQGANTIASADFLAL